MYSVRNLDYQRFGSITHSSPCRKGRKRFYQYNKELVECDCLGVSNQQNHVASRTPPKVTVPMTQETHGVPKRKKRRKAEGSY